MHEIVDEYDGRVAWVFRQLPIPSLHKKAETEALASECVAELAGNDAFWTYADKIFETTTSNDGLDLKLLNTFAEELGISKEAFDECLSSERLMVEVNIDANQAFELEARGTPFSVLVFGDTSFIIEGALPKADITKNINQLLNI